MAEISKIRFGGVDYDIKSVVDTTLTEAGKPADAATVGQALVTDETLSETGKAADALVTGTEIDKIKSGLSYVPTLSWNYGKIISAAGVISDSQYYALSDIVDCQKDDIFYNHTPNSDALSGFSCYHVLYTTTDSKNDTFYQRVGASSTRKMVIPAGVTGYRLLFGRSTSGGVPISSGDAEANVDLEIVRKGPSYEDLNESHKKSIKMLCIGNSYSQDSVAYMPFILRGLAENVKLTLGIAYYGGGTLTNHKEFFDSDSAEYTYNYLRSDSNAWASASGNQTLKQILAAEPWDVVTFQQGSKYQESWDNFGDLNPLIDRVIGYLATTHNKAVRVGWLMPQIRQITSTADSYANMIGCVKKVLETSPCSFVIPCGTAIHLARQTDLDNIGDAGHLTYEGIHLQEGLPCLISAYVSTIKMLELIGMEYKSILGEQTRPVQAWIDAKAIPGKNGTSVGVTDANCFLAQKLATQATKFPYGEE